MFSQITIAQFLTLCKRCVIVIVVSALIWAAAGASRLEAGFIEDSLENWQAGWQAWKAADYAAALREWSKDGIMTDFTRRPARNYYWRIRALTNLGRKTEAESLKKELARKYPFDYYTFLLFPDWGASAHPFDGYLKLAGMFYPRLWGEEVGLAASKTGAPKELIWAMMRRESKFRRYAISRAGAMGLMQLLPTTAADIAERIGIPPENTDLNKPEQNVLFGASYIVQLIRRFDGDLPRAVAAYNAGAANVERWSTLTASDWIEWVEEIPFPQTREYVRSVLENREVYLMTSGRNDLPRLAVIAERRLTHTTLAQSDKKSVNN